ncbi:recombinase family protein [Amycolatopsis sp. FDAARGOS 1241]|uniref:recombinase family protein n=1 Tax=Amycolatopsis sp. FDAARGOS 1241 TaxID=2778070 RepID=UPI00194EF1A3|nr:recombinase family protein [Amycolatopsis sp. FDAARGOS 1241]QRP48983.1 recombinase family protein [Amycolatopsis sp. FDAARGOS 1241]
MTKRAGAYLRISADPSQGGRSVSSQLTQARKDAEAQGATLADEDVFTETKSASIFGLRAGQVRTEWAKFIERVPALDIAILPEISRGTREQVGWQRFSEACIEHGTLLCAKGRIFDLTDESDRFIAGIEVLQADAEAVRISRRVKRGIAGAIASEGGARASAGPVPFGFKRPPRLLGEPVIQVHDEEQAQAIRELAKGLLAEPPTRSLTATAEDWLVRFPGRNWNANVIRKILKNPALIGMRKHKDQWHPAAWPPILDTVTFHRLGELFESRRTRTGQQLPSSLLSSLAECGVCGQKLTLRKPKDTVPGYNCKHTGIRVFEADIWVSATVVDLVAREILAEIRREVPEVDTRRLDAAIQAVTKAREDLESWYSEGARSGLPPAEVAKMARGYVQALKDAEAEERAARAALDQEPTPPATEVLRLAEFLRQRESNGEPDEFQAMAGALDAWENWTLFERREQIRKHVTVTVYPKSHSPRILVEPRNPSPGQFWAGYGEGGAWMSEMAGAGNTYLYEKFRTSFGIDPGYGFHELPYEIIREVFALNRAPEPHPFYTDHGSSDVR